MRNPEDSEQVRIQYLGALGLLAQCGVHLRSGSEGDELRELIEQALADGARSIPGLKWRRVLDSFEIDVGELVVDRAR